MEFKDRTGETIINQQGLQMTIYSYVNANQLKVVFEDGYISDWVPYHRFKAGKLKNPYYKDGKFLTKEEIAKTIIGETKKNGLGQEVTIVDFRGFDDIDVEVDDGTVLTGITYKDFCGKAAVNPDLKSKIGETVVTRNNGTQKLIAYNGYNDVSVEFEDGTIREHVRYDHFKEGKLSKHAWGAKNTSHLGEVTTNVQGMQAKIICYNSVSDIIVQFNSGERVRTTYSAFQKGRFKSQHSVGRTNRTHEDCLEERQGMTAFNKDGDFMKIVNYKGVNDIDVSFEDGSVVRSTTFMKFSRGTVKKPKVEPKEESTLELAEEEPDFLNIPEEELELSEEPEPTGETPEPTESDEQRNFTAKCYANVRIGEVGYTNSGERIEIVEYKSANDITVRFNDGTLKSGVSYSNFKRGRIRKFGQKQSDIYAKSRIGEIVYTKDGERIEIVAYRSAYDLTVRFEDGTLKSGVRYYKFKQGDIKKLEQPEPKQEKQQQSEQSLENQQHQSETSPQPSVQQKPENNLLHNAKSYLASARVLAKGEESALLASVMLCKRAVKNFLKAATGGNEEDIQFLGREAKKMAGIEVDPRDLAWLNDFDFEQEKSWLVPTMEDANMAIKVVEEIQEKCCSNGGN